MYFEKGGVGGWGIFTENLRKFKGVGELAGPITPQVMGPKSLFGPLKQN